MASKAKLAKESVEVTEGMLKSLLKKAQEAVRKGANSKKVEKIVESAGSGKNAYLKAEKKVLDVLTGTKRTKTGTAKGKTETVTLKDGTTTNVNKGFRSNKDVEAGTGRRIAKYGIRTSPLTGTGVAVGISATKRKKAEDARKAAAASEKNRKRSDAAEEEYKATRGGAAKRQAARDKKAAAAAALAKKGSRSSSPSAAGKGKGKLFPKFRPFGGVIARALLGDDEKFGGERGAIDFIRTKKKKKPVKKNMGGMMKKKGYSKGGAAKKKKGYAMGGMAKKGYSKGGAMKKKGYAMGGQASKFPDLNKDGKVTQADILKGRGVAKKNMGGSMKKKGYAMGGMTKKGYANGGMAKKGYAKGGPAKKTTAKKTSSRGKARGVGAATRGYGRAMKK